MKITEEVKQRRERKYPCLLQGHNGDVFYMADNTSGTRLSCGRAKLTCGLRYSNLDGDVMKYYTGTLVLEND